MKVTVLALLVCLALAGCGGAAPTPTVDVGPTQTRAAEVTQIAAIQATASAPTSTPVPTNTPLPTNTPTLPTPTQTPLPPTATPRPTLAPTRPPVTVTPTPTLGYEGARWHGIPTPGAPQIFQEEADNISLLIRGTPQGVKALYITALTQDGWTQGRGSETTEVELIPFTKAGKSITLGLNKKETRPGFQLVVLIED